MVATIFVNPLQFGPNEDFDRYPRTLEADLEICRGRGRRPGVRARPRRRSTRTASRAVRVDPGPLGEILEGASRPGYFHGVLTVVLKLLNLTRADLAFFGEKDYQQLTLIRRMVARPRRAGRDRRRADRAGGRRAGAVQPQPLPVAEPSGRPRCALSRALRAGAAAAARGADAPSLAAAAPESSPASTGVKLDYLVLIDPDLGPAPAHGPARLLVAARVGATRLIDNAVRSILLTLTA